jgi:hypothetical protein
MSFTRHFVLAVAGSALALLAGCGGGSGTARPTPPPTGAFTNSSLNGTYTFSVAGSDNAGIFTMAGSFVACGCSQGTISSGTVDIMNPSGPITGATLASKSGYSISPDGRGLARLFVANGTSVILSEFDIAFVLTSSSHGFVIRFDSNGTGSGSIDLQSGSLAQTALTASPYAFLLSGGDLNNVALSMAGAFTLDSSGTITSGVADLNADGASSAQLALSGSVTLGTGTAPGQAILSTTAGTFNFSVYPIDATHLKFIENDGHDILAGDAFDQPATTLPAGTLVFTMTGLNTNADLIAIGGLMDSDGVSLITNGSEDVNDGGVLDNNTNPAQPFAFTGTFASTGGGRYGVTFSNYVGGSVFAAYPSSAGVLMLEMDNVSGGVTAGVAVPQQPGAAVTASQGYALNLTGEDLSGFNLTELDEIAEFKTTSTTMTGLADQNDFGHGTGTVNLNGTYNLSNGLGSGNFTSGLPNLFFYPVDNSTAFFITADPTIAAVGSFAMQAAPGSAAAQASVRRSSLLPVQHVLPRARRKSAGTN